MKRGPSLMAIPVYVLGFLLLWEWFAPLSEITNTGGMGYFLVFTAFSLLINYLRLPWWLGMPLKAAVILIVLALLFGEPGSGFAAWITGFGEDFGYNIGLLFSREWYAMTDLFRSLLFLVIIWLMTYLLRYWLVVRKRIFIFYFMTVLYVAVLDTFTEYSGKTAIIRIVLIGFALLGILFYQRLLEKERLAPKPSILAKWALVLIIMVGGSAAFGFTAPKADPVWPDPVPFIQSKAEGIGSGGGIARIGYSWDDTELGGPFLGDDRVVFEVKTPTRQYWRIETKDVYTGKGWIASEKEEPIPFNAGDILNQGNYDPEKPEREAEFSIKIGYPHIIQPYGFMSVTGKSKTTFEIEPDLNRIKSIGRNGEETILKNYTVTYQQQEYSMKELRETNGMIMTHEDILLIKQYTQLPVSVPFRVKQLASDLTNGYDNWYDKAKAVERYLKSSEFTYDQTEVASPKEDQDYVDQFLFETKIGYCDNFSTSMITLLRSAGIPARWAKGYTAGKYHGEAGRAYRVFEVTNNEAHSWVEVYFPKVGWVPFEPTKGFTNFASFLQDEQNAASPAVPKRIESNTEKPKPKPEAGENAKKKASETEKKSGGTGLSISGRWLIAGVLSILAGAAAWLFFNREKWMPYILLRKYKEKEDKETFIRAYGDLLKQLDRFGVKKEPGQTLREYASYIDNHFGTDEMSRLTTSYERVTYSSGYSDEDWHNMKQLWENLIKRTTG